MSPMTIDLSGRVALVTGAAQGIGQAIAIRLAACGASVHLADIDASAAGGFAAERGWPLHVLDIADRPAAHAVAQEVVRHSGRLDILVNGAGGVRGQVGQPIAEVTEAAWSAVFDANIHGAFWMAQACASVMQSQGYGRMIHIASGAGLRPSLTGIQAYTAAKHALVGLAKQLSQDLGPHGITSNAIAPGFILSNPATRRQWESYGPDGQARLLQSIHTRRLGTPQDIAATAAFLASDHAGWLTGQIISVDGGRS
jgi:3-oxoacyl-[acyl-carrier protein] reductase